jgi:hypothetical protein
VQWREETLKGLLEELRKKAKIEIFQTRLAEVGP